MNDFILDEQATKRAIALLPYPLVSTLAGSAAGTAGYADCAGAAAHFNAPAGLTMGALSGILTVAESTGQRLRRVNTVSGAVST